MNFVVVASFYVIVSSYRVDPDRHRGSESMTGGFESPKSEKSWSKEFDESRQSTLRSRRGTADTIISQADIEINDQFRSLGHGKEQIKPGIAP